MSWWTVRVATTSPPCMTGTSWPFSARSNRVSASVAVTRAHRGFKGGGEGGGAGKQAVDGAARHADRAGGGEDAAMLLQQFEEQDAAVGGPAVAADAGRSLGA
jgi:hypothetical protein